MCWDECGRNVWLQLTYAWLFFDYKLKVAEISWVSNVCLVSGSARLGWVVAWFWWLEQNNKVCSGVTQCKTRWSKETACDGVKSMNSLYSLGWAAADEDNNLEWCPNSSRLQKAHQDPDHTAGCSSTPHSWSSQYRYRSSQHQPFVFQWFLSPPRGRPPAIILINASVINWWESMVWILKPGAAGQRYEKHIHK